jgi:hypothetical protein
VNRRRFLELLSLGSAWPGVRLDAAAPETLYNGLQLPTPWPPRYDLASLPSSPPYLLNRPSVVNIDVGRQLFVDDFLIEETTLTRSFYRATYHSLNPVLRPDRPWEKTALSPTAMVFSDGVVWDPGEQRFRMWYMGGYTRATCLATSQDGVHWSKPALGVVPGTNIVVNEARDSSTVWFDRSDLDPARRYKMLRFPPGATRNTLACHVSADGVHWRYAGRSGVAGDRTSVFWNPFRNVWVFSLRAGGDTGGPGRHRLYLERPQFVSDWTDAEPLPWTRSDALDLRRDDTGDAPQLYNLDCVAYESILLGLFTIWRGEFRDRPKANDVCVGFSRDGFHWSRPHRSPILPMSEDPNDWNWANVQSSGGCCLVVGSQLFFYVSGRQGRSGSSEPGTCSTGLATMRRDGFAAMTTGRTGEPGMLTTRPVRFSGGHLFVNADVNDGDLRAEILDQRGQVIEPYTRATSVSFRGDSTCHRMTWSTRPECRALAGEPVRFRFFLTRGRLFAFWVSPTPAGASRGYLAAGAAGVSDATDVGGQHA